MMETRKDIARLVVVSVIIVCYVFCITVPFLQTFGQSYVHKNNFYSHIIISCVKGNNLIEDVEYIGGICHAMVS